MFTILSIPNLEALITCNHMIKCALSTKISCSRKPIPNIKIPDHLNLTWGWLKNWLNMLILPLKWEWLCEIKITMGSQKRNRNSGIMFYIFFSLKREQEERANLLDVIMLYSKIPFIQLIIKK